MADQSKFDFSDKKILQNIIASIVETVSPDKIILFGSRATGKARKDSDYDVCVLKGEIKNRSEFLSDIYKNIDAKAPVDVIAISTSRYEELKNKWYYVYYYINKEGLVVYEK